jgi:hypothetical protein
MKEMKFWLEIFENRVEKYSKKVMVKSTAAI